MTIMFVYTWNFLAALIVFAGLQWLTKLHYMKLHVLIDLHLISPKILEIIQINLALNSFQSNILKEALFTVASFQ